jgi:hypothetical protein
MIGARALGFETRTNDGDAVWELALSRAGARDEAPLELLWRRGCNRRTAPSQPVAPDELEALRHAGAPLDTSIVTHDRLTELGTALGMLDRIRFLSARLRRDMIGELRFTSEEAHATRDGIEVASLDLDPADRAAMDVLRLGVGMDFLAQIDRGWGLANLARDAFKVSAAALVLRADPQRLVDAGRGLMRLWLEATRRRLAIHPWGSPFLFKHLFEAGALDEWERASLTEAAARLGAITPLDAERPILLILRVSRHDQPSVRSLRRPVEDVLSYAASAGEGAERAKRIAAAMSGTALPETPPASNASTSR